MVSAAPATTPLPPGRTLSYAAATPALPPAFPLQIKTYPARVAWRSHRLDPVSNRYRATAYNASGLGDARFSPIFDQHGYPIPTMYVATEARTAIAETLLHDAPVPSSGYIFDATAAMAAGAQNVVSSVMLPALNLVPLTSFALQAVGLTVPQLIGGDHSRYPSTRAWSLWIHEQMPAAQGLYWMSRRDDENASMVLFGDRIGPALVELSCDPLSAHKATLFEVLDALGATGI